jgi:uncharacterized protein
MKNKNVLITGGSGLIGYRLTELLIEKGYVVSHLSRKEDLKSGIKKYRWDSNTKFFDEKALKNTDYIIHLAGAGIADERWTEERKKEILDSRINSTALLFDNLKKVDNKVKVVVSASAIGYYGFAENGIIFDENDKPGTDFLANVTELVKVRIGVVLSEKGGALPQMALPVKLFAGSPLGSGEQMISWIDLDDLCNLFIFAIENDKMKGAYNAVAPNPVSNKAFTQAIAKALNRPVWPIKVPKFLLKMALGEMEVVVSGGSEIKNKRIAEETNFVYEFPNLEKSLKKHLK